MGLGAGGYHASAATPRAASGAARAAAAGSSGAAAASTGPAARAAASAAASAGAAGPVAFALAGGRREAIREGDRGCVHVAAVRRGIQLDARRAVRSASVLGAGLELVAAGPAEARGARFV